MFRWRRRWNIFYMKTKTNITTNHHHKHVNKKKSKHNSCNHCRTCKLHCILCCNFRNIDIFCEKVQLKRSYWQILVSLVFSWLARSAFWCFFIVMLNLASTLAFCLLTYTLTVQKWVLCAKGGGGGGGGESVATGFAKSRMKD